MVIVTMDYTINLLISIYILIVKEVSCCGNRCVAGGMITFTASDNGQQIIMRTYHLWESNINQNCTADNIDQELLNVGWQFYAKSVGLLYTAIKCKDFNIEDNWSLGYSETLFNTTNTVLYGQGLYYSGGGHWRDLTNGGAQYALYLRANTSIRTDTGSTNNSPTPVLVPVVKFRYGCWNTHHIEVTDIDGDFVKCRLAAYRNTITGNNECYSICGSLPGIEINMESCLLSYNGAEPGTFAVGVQIEDFIDSTTTTPLSSVPMKFIVTVTDDGLPCDTLNTTTKTTTTTTTTTTPSTTTTTPTTTTTTTPSTTTTMQPTTTTSSTPSTATTTSSTTTTFPTTTTTNTTLTTTTVSTPTDAFQLNIILITLLSIAVLCVVILTICICVMRQRRQRKNAAQRCGNMTGIGHQHPHNLSDLALTNISDITRGSEECK